jgi:ADP-ribose pyrophosphatase
LTAFVLESVGVPKCGENTLDDVPRRAIRQPQALGLIKAKDSRQCNARYILEDEGGEARLLAERPHLDDTRVFQSSADRGLPSQRIRAPVGLVLAAGDGLDCNESSSRTSGEEYLAATPDAEALQNVEPFQRSGKLVARKHTPSTFGANAEGAKGLELPIPFVLQIQGVPPRPLPALPAIGIAVVRDRTATARATGGFLDIQRVDLVASYPDGTSSEPFAYDVATRKALDAVVMAAFYADRGVHYVFLRSAVRPPCALRSIAPAHDGGLWELPAGLVEPGESPADAAARELGEELGFAVAPGAMRPLGEWTFPAPGIIAERHVFLAVEVDPRKRALPTEDGSPLERAAAIVALPVEEAIEHCRRGDIRDAKTELGLRRLAEIAL